MDPNATYVDLNRSGVALMEIVSKPDIRTPLEAAAYVKKLKSIVVALGTCDGDMDIQLPDVSGLDLTRWLKDDERTSAIPVLAVTAFAMRTDEILVREAGCEGYLSKPIQVRSFLKTVDDLMYHTSRTPVLIDVRKAG